MDDLTTADRNSPCELVFESANELFHTLERNGTQIRNNLPWDSKDQTSDVIDRRDRIGLDSLMTN